MAIIIFMTIIMIIISLLMLWSISRVAYNNMLWNKS